MKRIQFILVLVFLAPILAFGQDCADFKVGTFKLKDDKGNFIPDYKIVRKKNKQTEYLPNGGMIVSKVVWTSDCTYELIHLKNKNYDVIKKGNVTRIKIVKTFEGGYEGIGSSEMQPQPLTFTMYKTE